MRSVLIKRDNRMFPERLLSVKPEVKQIWVKGAWDNGLFDRAIAVVGSRRMSGYGKEVIGSVVSGLVRAGVSIVSGFMYGVDREAHKVCLASGGRTVAVLGWGIDVKAGVEDRELYEDILQKHGVFVSEYEGERASALWMFPQRNRIISGLSDAVLVIEGAKNSGTLISAGWAEKQKKKIMAVPGRIGGVLSYAPNYLIKTGKASLVESAGDILQIMGWSGGVDESKHQGLHLDEKEKRVVSALEVEELAIDDLVRVLGMSVASLSTVLTSMEMKGLIERRDGKIGVVRELSI